MTGDKPTISDGVSYWVTRFNIDVGQPYEAFRKRYEAAVPALDEQASTR
jgi:hypothetical protein